LSEMGSEESVDARRSREQVGGSSHQGAQAFVEFEQLIFGREESRASTAARREGGGKRLEIVVVSEVDRDR